LRNLFDIEDIDYKNRNIPEEVAPYAKCIFEDCRKEENKFKINPNYMD